MGDVEKNRARRARARFQRVVHKNP